MSTDEEFVKWAWNNGFGYINSDELVVLFKQATSKLKTKLLYAEDAATKGELARQNAGGMELEIKELRERNRNLAIVMKQQLIELGELSGPPLSRRVNLILEAKALLNETRNKS